MWKHMVFNKILSNQAHFDCDWVSHCCNVSHNFDSSSKSFLLTANKSVFHLPASCLTNLWLLNSCRKIKWITSVFKTKLELHSFLMLLASTGEAALPGRSKWGKLLCWTSSFPYSRAQMVVRVCIDSVKGFLFALVSAWCHSVLIKWGTVGSSITCSAMQKHAGAHPSFKRMWSFTRDLCPLWGCIPSVACTIGPEDIR